MKKQSNGSYFAFFPLMRVFPSGGFPLLRGLSLMRGVHGI
jgi:hypothetical protein